MRHPKPVDPLFYRWNAVLVVRCANPECPKDAVRARVSDWAGWARADPNMRIHDFCARMICSECGKRDVRYDVEDWR